MNRLLQPRRPDQLPELTEATLEALRGEPFAGNIILGGGVALQHYDNFRATQDVDAWWQDFRDENTLAKLLTLLEKVAREHGYELEHRQFGTTDSLEFKSQGDNKKVFSFQISVRDVSLEEPWISAWPPLLIETFQDNIGSKMNALVNRGAPRDLLDIYRVVHDSLITSQECWRLWNTKNPAGNIADAKGKVRTHLNRLEQRRPLEHIADAGERSVAELLRTWYKDSFLAMDEEVA
ncbi:MAG: hypothetical protein OHK0029_35340 [Armatimonadaceae bacterium]